MAERIFSESEALLDALSDALGSLDIGMYPQDILVGLSEGQIDALNDELVSIYDEMSPPDLVSRVEDQAIPRPPEGYGLRLRTQLEEGKPVRMDIYLVKKSWLTTALSLTSFSFALYMGSPTAVLSAIGLIRNTWNNLFSLKRPEDALALECYDALLKVQAKKKQSSKIASYYPSLVEIQSEAGHTKKEDTVNGMTRLLAQGLVKVKEWADQGHNYQHPDNRWYQVF